jgi:GT2 family glycosyltransferase/glycosyltransferase involved in cell wall biosynthesis
MRSLDPGPLPSSPANHFGGAPAVRTVTEKRYSFASEHPWHGDAYDLALEAARRIGSREVLVLGCASGAAAVERLVPAGLTVSGWDIAVEIEEARKRHPDGQWAVCDFGSPTELEALAGDSGPLVILVPGTLERLLDPRPLLRAIRRMMLASPGSTLVVAALNHPDDAPPEVANHRQWTHTGLCEFLRGWGFELERHLSGRARSGDSIGTGTVVEASLDRARYDRFLEARHLPPSGLHRLVLSTEHGRCKVTGGIGAYVEEQLAISGGSLAVGLLTNTDNLPDAEVLSTERWLLPQRLGLPETHERPCDQALALVEQALALYPDLREIEFQDYLGVGARLVQARASGLLPRQLGLHAICHGAQVYIERANQAWMDVAQLPTHVEEQIALEGADTVTFLTRYLHGLYAECGVAIPPERIRFERAPFRGFELAPLPATEAADTIIFFGKRSVMKGFPLFVQALRKLMETPAGSKLKRLVLLGPRMDELVQENAYVESLRSRLEVLELSLSRPEALKTLRALGPGSICVTPYTADNHPFAVLEVVASGCQLLACAEGGIPELVPPAVAEHCLVEFHPEALGERLGELLELDGGERRRLVGDTFRAFRDAQAEINRRVAAAPPVAPSSSVRVVPECRGTVGLIVPCYDTGLPYLEELVWSINQQTRLPDKVVFVDDGSSGGFAPKLRTLLDGRAAFSYQLIRHGVNRGLAAARNTGLRELRTDYVINIDSDDIARNDFVQRYADALDADPGLAAVTSYVDYFSDGTDWRLEANTDPRAYRPHGAGGIWSQIQNSLGHANSAYRAGVLRELGGWDESDAAMWEDWALFLKLQSHGARIGVVPRATFLYRSRPTSMARTYSRFTAQARLARSTTSLSRSDALRLQAVLSDYQNQIQKLGKRLELLQQRYDGLQLEHSRFRSRIGRRVAEAVERHQGFFSGLRLSKNLASRLVKTVRGKERLDV